MSISFFFSSRRRHTRFDCDWSSDVCSSDLRRFADFKTQTLSPTRRMEHSRDCVKYVIVTGGVLSGLGKGISTSSIGVLLKSKGLKVCPVKIRSEEHTSELQSQSNIVCRLLLEKKK